jgi:phosphate acyltransferase
VSGDPSAPGGDPAPGDPEIRAVRVAVDLLGGDGAPGVVADAVGLLLAQRDDVDLVVVGPPETARALVAAGGADPDSPRLSYAPAAGVVGMADDALDLVRTRRDLTVRVGAELVADGGADALVSVGHTGAAVAASLFALGRLPGMTRPALAVLVPSLSGPVLLLDVGAGTSATPDLLCQFALAGTAYARALGIAEPRVGLLTIGAEPGKGDALRQEAAPLLAALPVRYVGPVEGHDVALGGTADVVVTDGFTGNVLLKAVEGAVAWSAERLGAAYGDREPARAAARTVATGDFSGGMLLGVRGICVVGHGAATPGSVVAGIGLAARAARHGLVDTTGALLLDLLARREDGSTRPATPAGAVG